VTELHGLSDYVHLVGPEIRPERFDVRVNVRCIALTSCQTRQRNNKQERNQMELRFHFSVILLNLSESSGKIVAGKRRVGHKAGVYRRACLVCAARPSHEAGLIERPARLPSARSRRSATEGPTVRSAAAGFQFSVVRFEEPELPAPPEL